MKRRSKATAFVLTAMAIALGVWLIWSLNAAERREDAWRAKGYPTTLTELDEWYERPPDGENAADFYLEAGDLIDNSDFPELSRVAVLGYESESAKLGLVGEEVSEEELRRTAAFIKYHERAYQLIAEAAELEGSRYPVDLKDPFMAGFEHFSNLRQVWRAMLIKTYYYCAIDETGEAVEAFGQMAHALNSIDDEPTVLSGATRSSLLEGATKSFEYVVDTVTLSSEDCETLDGALRSLTNNDHMLRMAVGDRLWVDGVFKRAPTFSKALGAYNQRNQIESIDEFIALLEQPLHETVEELYRFDTDDYAWIPLHDIGMLDRATQHLPYKGDWYLVWFVKNYHVENARIAAARAAVVVEHARANGEPLPEKASDLPEYYFERWPADPFTSEPIRYRKLATGYVTYSVGHDLKDDEGGVDDDSPNDAHHERDCPDVTFRVFR